MARRANVTLKTTTEFSGRKLSISEYYHACLGTSGKTLEVPRENQIILEGEGPIDIDGFRRAVSRAAQANPGSRLRLAGNSLRARWIPDGQEPKVRTVSNCTWDGMSHVGSGFIRADELSANEGVTGEFVVATAPSGKKQFIVFRNLHSIMDGMGYMHFLQEVFRAMRGEKLAGTNAFFREADLMLSVDSDRRAQIRYKDFKVRPAYATGGPRGGEIGDSWQKTVIEGPLMLLSARVSAAVAEFAHRYSDTKARIAVPVNLRRHMPEISSTMNLTGLQYIELFKGDSFMKFQQILHEALKKNNDTNYAKSSELLRMLPFSWMERLSCRTPRNYLKHRIIETIMVSDLGGFKAKDFTGGGFSATQLFGVPLPGNAFGLLSTLDNRVAVTIGMPKVYANEGRLSALMDHITAKLDQ